MTRLTYYPDSVGPVTYECATAGCDNTGPNRYCGDCTSRKGPSRHGYTLDAIHHIARLAVHTVGAMGIDWHDRYDIAYSAIAETLYASEQSPQRHELVRAGQLAIYDTISDYRHHHGYYKHKTIGSDAGPGSSPNFAKFWATGSATPVEVLVDRLTVQQILPNLTARQRDALGALAALDDYRAAAHHLGIAPQTYRSLLGRARKEFFALWHEGEVPSKPWGTDRRVGRYDTETERAA